MKKSLLILIGAAVVVAVGVGIYMASRPESEPAPNVATEQTKQTSTFKPEIKNACDILTSDLAVKLIGKDAKKGSASAADTENETVKVTQCNYTVVADLYSVSLLIRAAKSQDQADANAKQFDGKRRVPGYGEAAYWDEDYAQLNILKNNNWYILSSGSMKPSERSLAEAKQFANFVQQQL